MNRQSILPLLLLVACLAVPDAALAQNPDRGREINSTCAGCHGEQGQGGSRGEYPRLAGQRAAYLVDQLKSFRSRTRVNIPMYPYTQERELPDEDIKDVAAYLESIDLPTKWPVFKESDDALTRLTLTERVMIIPRAPGNLANGEAIYRKQCVTCHAKNGMGRGKFPRLVGQYTNYLKRQMEKYVKGERPHDEEGTGGLLNALKEDDMQDVLAYLTTLQELQQ